MKLISKKISDQTRTVDESVSEPPEQVSTTTYEARNRLSESALT
jgi:hypothetical protein